jgi:hypothetical protein
MFYVNIIYYLLLEKMIYHLKEVWLKTSLKFYSIILFR